MPGPPIIADWGDDLVIHVTNNMQSMGTTVHWHGVRQLDSVQHDGVPGVTQCPIPPGETMTYKYKVTQYGTSWYHSHISLQYSEGLFGPLIFRGPATDNYDEDLGALFLQDWSHEPNIAAWENKVRYGMTHSLSNLLINGTNTFDCSSASDDSCVGGGKKFQTVFKPGKKYLIRLINVATDSQFQFSIDGHKLRVIANDFVPIKPYDTDSIVINAAQRYDLIVEANAPVGDYWLRAVWVDACAGVANDHPEDSTGIIRYDASSTNEPTSVSAIEAPTVCSDEPLESLIPHMGFDVSNIGGTTVEELRVRFTHEALFTWTINTSSLALDWSNPTLTRMFNHESVFPSEYNVVPVNVSEPSLLSSELLGALSKKKTSSADEWAVLVIQNKVIGLLGTIAHPIHLHGHDFWILAQATGPWDGTTDSFTTINPPRRDTATLPAQGHLAIAFRLDNPGTWLLHCHIVWHASQGLALEIVESEEGIQVTERDRDVLGDLCEMYDGWAQNGTGLTDGSGI
ncbi:MAG: hypothetical protein Q9213_000347 [Squamulea squamosa]